MKQIIQHFNRLPLPYRMQAISNTSNDTLFFPTTTLKEALVIAFIWSNTNEGQNYWKNVYELAKVLDSSNQDLEQAC